ncbi:MAG: DUF421 domain-containing protein [Clostridia bacterium]|nr:DUF421 domain-containing protein [Clostridia bacterium]
MPNYIQILLNAVYSFVALFLISKILGKKQIAELNFTDYIVGITIGSIAAEWSTDVVNPWYYYAIALGIFLIFSFVITQLERTTLFLKSFLRGKPILIIKDGKIDYENLKKSKLDVNDLLGMCRNKGYFNLTNVAFAIFETNGDLSILPIGKQKPAVAEDLNLKIQPVQLTKFVIDDGIVDKNYLQSLNKDNQWLFKELKINSKKDLKNILVAFYDEKTGEFDVHYKK